MPPCNRDRCLARNRAEAVQTPVMGRTLATLLLLAVAAAVALGAFLYQARSAKFNLERQVQAQEVREAQNDANAKKAAEEAGRRAEAAAKAAEATMKAVGDEAAKKAEEAKRAAEEAKRAAEEAGRRAEAAARSAGEAASRAEQVARGAMAAAQEAERVTKEAADRAERVAREAERAAEEAVRKAEAAIPAALVRKVLDSWEFKVFLIIALLGSIGSAILISVGVSLVGR